MDQVNKLFLSLVLASHLLCGLQTDEQDFNLPGDVITIITDDDDFPQGQYWPSKFVDLDPNGQLLDTGFVKIGDQSFNNIIRSFDFLDNHDYIYLGHFTNTQGETVYLYDQHDYNNDASAETLAQEDEDDNDENDK